VQKLKEYRKLAVIALLASVLAAAPFAIRAYAQNDDQANPVVETVEEEQNEEQPQTEEETPPPPEEEEVTEEDETPVEEEEAPVPTPVSITDAIAIAQAEHPGVEVVMAKVKLKKLEDKKVYKIVFADGWRIYVRASDGQIVRIKDASNKKRACSDRGLRAVANWRHHHKKRWGHAGNHGFTHKQKDWSRWNKPGQKPESDGGQPERDNEQEQPAETEEQTVGQ